MASISVVIPAYNREATLGVSLDALLAQTHADWEAIVVDDGSADGTAAVAEEYARRDPRIRLHRQANAGVSAARNTGIGLARHPWLFFLDADDWIVPEAFALLADALARHPDAELVNGGCVRVLSDGTELEEARAPTGDDLFLMFARTCAFSIHTSLVRTELVRDLGGFDSSLVTCEDWDLWQRITRTGARFAAIPENIAYYRIRPGSASGNGRRMLEDGLRVIARGHGDDPRLHDWRGTVRSGEPAERSRAPRLYLAGYTAGLEIARGRDATSLLELLPEREPGDVNANGMAATLFHAIAGGRGTSVPEWADFPPEVHARLHEFVDALGAFTGDRWFAFGVHQQLEELILHHSTGDDALMIGRTQVARVRVDEPVADFAVGDGAARLLLDLRWEEESLGVVVLPAFGAAVPAAVVADAVTDAQAWAVLRRFFGRSVYPSLTVAHGERLVARRGRVTLFDGPTEPAVQADHALHNAVGWLVLLQELWGRPDWDQGRYYAESSLPLRGERPARTVAVADLGPVEIADDLPEVTGVEGPLDVDVTLAGVPLMRVRVVPARGRIAPQALRSAITYAGGFELCHVAVREGVLLYDGDQRASLRERLATVAQRRAAQRPGAVARNGVIPGWDAVAREMTGGAASTLLLGRRRYGQLSGAASRITALPPESLDDVRALARHTGQPLLAAGNGQPPGALLYAPFVVDADHEPVEFGARSRARAESFERRRSFAPSPADPTVVDLRRADVRSLLPERADQALQVGADDAALVEELAERAGHVVVADISWLALQQAATRAAARDNVSFQRTDLLVEPLAGGHDLVVCGDVLRWAEGRRSLQRGARRLGDALAPGGTLVVTSSAARAAEIERALLAGGRLGLREEVVADTFRVQRYERLDRRRLPLGRGRVVRRESALGRETPAGAAAGAPTGGAMGAAPTQSLPVLMYHRIAEHGHEKARRWRLTPGEFEEQLAHLRDNGYRSVDIDEWADAVAGDRRLPARGVVLTFDDAFVDFADHALPLLQRYGFRAELFVVTGHVGGTDSWDAGWDQRERLLDWPALLDLPADVVRIGSHTVGHKALTAVSAREAVHELIASRIELEDRLGRRVASIAYPYGLIDGAVQRLVGAVGYEVGFTTMPWWTFPSRNLLQLPRLEVRGGDDLSTFSRMVERPLV